MQHNLGQFLAKRAELNPRLEALVDVATGRRFTYAELNGRANRIAHALAGLGVQKGDRVATLLMNSPEFVEAFFGSAKIGAVLTPLNWRLVADELAFILTDSGAETLVFGGEFSTVVADLHARGSQGTAVRTWIYVGKPADRPAFAVSYEDLHGAAPAREPEIRAANDDLLYVVYTSGTTGLPKGVMNSHGTTMWAVLTVCATADLRFKDRFLICLPLFHVGALLPLLVKGTQARAARAVPGVGSRVTGAERTFQRTLFAGARSVPSAMATGLLKCKGAARIREEDLCGVQAERGHTGMVERGDVPPWWQELGLAVRWTRCIPEGNGGQVLFAYVAPPRHGLPASSWLPGAAQ